MTNIHPVSLWRHDTIHPRPVTMSDIAARVAEKHRLTVADLKGQSRRREFAWPRQEAMHECRAATDRSTTAIGRFFGGRDHATVIHGVRRHQERIDQELEASHG